MTIPRLSRPVLTASLAVLPYLAATLADIFGHPGSYIHFSKGEAVALTAMLALFQWLACVAILIVSAALARGMAWLQPAIAMAAFAALAALVEPRFGYYLFDLRNGGLAEWLFRTGLLATLLLLCLEHRRRRAVRHH